MKLLREIFHSKKSKTKMVRGDSLGILSQELKLERRHLIKSPTDF
jgi:hypothetical protein